MTVYTLFDDVTAAQAAPGIAQPSGNAGGDVQMSSSGAMNVPPGSQAVFPGGGAGAPTAPPTNQQFQLIVIGSGAVSAAAQIFGTNDGVNWTSTGSSISAASAQTVSTATASGTAGWAGFTAQLTTISGTNASATLLMNA
jgi:hypothetical protein